MSGFLYPSDGNKPARAMEADSSKMFRETSYRNNISTCINFAGSRFDGPAFSLQARAI